MVEREENVRKLCKLVFENNWKWRVVYSYLVQMSDSWSSSVSYSAFVLMGNNFFWLNVCNQNYSKLVSINSPPTTPATLSSMCLEICNFWNSAAVYEKLNMLLCFRGDKTFAVWEREDSNRGANRGNDGLREKMCQHTSRFGGGAVRTRFVAGSISGSHCLHQWKNKTKLWTSALKMYNSRPNMSVRQPSVISQRAQQEPVLGSTLRKHT